MSASPSLPRSAPQAEPLLELRGLVKHHRLPRDRLFGPAPVVQALRGVNLQLRAGHNLGIVGESGSGKSTLARLALALDAPTAGQVLWNGVDVHTLSAAALRQARRGVQAVFQDPGGSLDPRQRVGHIVAEPLWAETGLSAVNTPARVAEALDAVGLRASDAAKYPHEFSGGQRQRIAIARALITRPALIVADEPVSALDVSVQAQVLNLLHDVQRAFGLSYVLISHDLAVVNHLCAEVAVLYAGSVVEQGPPSVLFHHAAHPYTQALVAAVPQFGTHSPNSLQQGLQAVRPLVHAASAPASSPSSAARHRANATLRSGCAYAQHCPRAVKRCLHETPLLRNMQPVHQVACHLAE